MTTVCGPLIMLYLQVDGLLDTADAIIYILDYTKLKTAEEANLFSRLKDINPDLVCGPVEVQARMRPHDSQPCLSWYLRANNYK